jgi:hypothetical protein
MGGMSEDRIEAVAIAIWRSTVRRDWKWEDIGLDARELWRKDARAALEAADTWQPIKTAPTDGSLFLVWAPEYVGLPSIYSLCAYHPDAGFCIDELREPTHWMPLPEPPKGK